MKQTIWVVSLHKRYCSYAIQAVHLFMLCFYSHFRSMFNNRQFISDSSIFDSKECRSALTNVLNRRIRTWHQNCDTYCTVAQQIQSHFSYQAPPQITQSACISCYGPRANPFLIHSYNLEGLSADLPVQATNGWAKGLHWCAPCTALPLTRQERELFCDFHQFSDAVSTVSWRSKRGVIQRQRYKLLQDDKSTANGVLQWTWPWPGSNPIITCHQCQARHNCLAPWGRTEKSWHIIRLSLQHSRLFKKQQA